MAQIKIIECPRDAMQGIKEFIPTEKKVQYIQSFLRCGFDTIDFGSFVSPKAIPQMADTAEVLSRLDLSRTQSKLLAIVANTSGAQDASQHPEIQYLGYPFSISENFQMRNTHKTIAESVETLQEILDIARCIRKRGCCLSFHGLWKSLWRSMGCGDRRGVDREAFRDGG